MGIAIISISWTIIMYPFIIIIVENMGTLNTIGLYFKRRGHLRAREESKKILNLSL